MISLNSLLYPHELEELRLESIKMLETLLFFLEKNSTQNSSDLSTELTWDNPDIIRYTSHMQFEILRIFYTIYSHRIYTRT